MHFVYILESLKDNSWYIGFTSNLKQRIKAHNLGRSKSTNQRRPYKLVCYIAFPTKNDAINYEKYLKSGYGRRTLKKMLADYLSRKN